MNNNDDPLPPRPERKGCCSPGPDERGGAHNLHGIAWIINSIIPWQENKNKNRVVRRQTAHNKDDIISSLPLDWENTLMSIQPLHTQHCGREKVAHAALHLHDRYKSKEQLSRLKISPDS